MANLETTYLGLKLRNPVIAGSSGLTNSIENIKEIEKNGAGAVVIKSIFEEQINSESQYLINHDHEKVKAWKDTFESIVNHRDYYYEEALNYVQSFAQENAISKYLKLLENAKKTVQIPVIASINCVSKYEWMYFAKKLQDTGVDAIELNIYLLPSVFDQDEKEVERTYIDIISEVLKYISIPLSVKIGFYFSALASSVKKISETGISGIVLFNRPFNHDIDIEKFVFNAHNIFSNSAEYNHTLRWTGILSGRINCDISSTTGIHDYSTVVKMLLAGAQTVQLASVLYQKGFGEIKNIVSGLEGWMDKHSFNQIENFRGKMSLNNIENPASYERVQFMKHYSNIE
ncbi:MAG: dihydroorotate dehydrogenase-like protein [Bacteroidales bacterium]